jgi:hypothetical protein
VFDRDMADTRVRALQDLLEPERDDLIAQRDGLETVLADETLKLNRRVAAYHRAILRDGLTPVMEVLQRVGIQKEQSAISARGLAECRSIAGSGLLDRLEEAKGHLRVPLRWRAPAAEKIVLVFTGPDTRFWAHHVLQFRALKPFGQHILFLQDSRLACYTDGIDGLRRGYENSLEDLRALCSELGNLPIYCMGRSTGGFGALRFGLDLEAQAVLAFSPRTSLAANLEPRADEVYARDMLGERAIDLKPLFAARTSIPRLTLYYGALNGSDVRHAQRFADLPGAQVIALEGLAGHNSQGRLIAEKKNDTVLAEFLTQRRVTGAEPAERPAFTSSNANGSGPEGEGPEPS